MLAVQRLSRKPASEETSINGVENDSGEPVKQEESIRSEEPAESEKPIKPAEAAEPLKSGKKPLAVETPVKKEIFLDTPGLTWEQKVWIGTVTLWHSVTPLLCYLLIPALFMTIGMTVRSWKAGAEAFIDASGNFYRLLGIICCFWLLKYRCERRGENFSDAATFYWQQPDWKKIGDYVILGAALSVFLSAVLTFLPFAGSYTASAEAPFQRTDLFLAMASVFVMAPICEETVFRGFMLNRLLRQFGEWPAVLISSGIFAVCHVNLLWMLYAFAMGVFLAEVSLKEDNILYSVVLHSAFNAPAMINVLICQFPRAEQLFYGNRIFVICYGLLALGVLILWFRKHQGFWIE